MEKNVGMMVQKGSKQLTSASSFLRNISPMMYEQRQQCLDLIVVDDNVPGKGGRMNLLEVS